MENKDWIILGLAFVPLMLVYLHSYNYEVFYFLYNISGIRAIVEKIHPPIEHNKDFRKPSTFVLWMVSIYFVLYGVASSRYEQAVNSLGLQIAGFQTQMATKSRPNACRQIQNLQEALVPIKPELMNVKATIFSLFYTEIYHEGFKLTLQTLETYKDILNDSTLNNIDMANINFEYALLNRSTIKNSNLKDANMFLISLKNATLWCTNLENAYLETAQLQNSVLAGISFKNATPYGADMTDADLRMAAKQTIKEDGSTIIYDIKTDLSKADCSGAILKDTNFSATILRGADFSHTSGSKTIFTSADITGANFENSHLRGTNFIDSNIQNTNFKNADLQAENNFSDVRKIVEDKTVDTYFENKTTPSKFYLANLYKSTFDNATLHKANITRANLTSTSFKDANMSQCILSGSNLTYTSFKNADLSDSDFSPLSLFDDKTKEISKTIATHFNNTDFSNANLTGANLSYADLRTALGLTYEQLIKAKYLYRAKLPAELDRKILKYNWKLFYAQPKYKLAYTYTPTKFINYSQGRNPLKNINFN